MQTSEIRAEARFEPQQAIGTLKFGISHCPIIQESIEERTSAYVLPFMQEGQQSSGRYTFKLTTPKMSLVGCLKSLNSFSSAFATDLTMTNLTIEATENQEDKQKISNQYTNIDKAIYEVVMKEIAAAQAGAQAHIEALEENTVQCRNEIRRLNILEAGYIDRAKQTQDELNNLQKCLQHPAEYSIVSTYPLSCAKIELASLNEKQLEELSKKQQKRSEQYQLILQRLDELLDKLVDLKERVFLTRSSLLLPPEQEHLNIWKKQISAYACTYQASYEKELNTLVFDEQKSGLLQDAKTLVDQIKKVLNEPTERLTPETRAMFIYFYFSIYEKHQSVLGRNSFCRIPEIKTELSLYKTAIAFDQNRTHPPALVGYGDVSSRLERSLTQLIKLRERLRSSTPSYIPNNEERNAFYENSNKLFDEYTKEFKQLQALAQTDRNKLSIQMGRNEDNVRALKIQLRFLHQHAGNIKAQFAIVESRPKPTKEAISIRAYEEAAAQEMLIQQRRRSVNQFAELPAAYTLKSASAADGEEKAIEEYEDAAALDDSAQPVRPSTPPVDEVVLEVQAEEADEESAAPKAEQVVLDEGALAHANNSEETSQASNDARAEEAQTPAAEQPKEKVPKPPQQERKSYANVSKNGSQGSQTASATNNNQAPRKKRNEKVDQAEQSGKASPPRANMS